MTTSRSTIDQFLRSSGEFRSSAQWFRSDSRVLEQTFWKRIVTSRLSSCSSINEESMMLLYTARIGLLCPWNAVDLSIAISRPASPYLCGAISWLPAKTVCASKHPQAYLYSSKYFHTNEKRCNYGERGDMCGIQARYLVHLTVHDDI